MTRRVPIIPTIVVLAAVATMVALGVWQLQRAEWKADLLARYRQAQSMSSDAPWPRTAGDAEAVLYRHATLDCVTIHAMTSRSGRNAADEPGLAIHADCEISNGNRADVVLGWSKEPQMREIWKGGRVAGIIAPGPRLVADPPVGDLEANQVPDPEDIPNNHLSYAIQWFFFALTALVIYGLALRKRLSDLRSS